MSVVSRLECMNAANRLRLEIRHFAKGTWPPADGAETALPVNRFFMPLCNPSGEACFVADRQRHLTLVPGRAYFIPSYHPSRMLLDSALHFISIQFNCELCDGIDIFSRCRQILELEGACLLARAKQAYDCDDDFTAASLLRALVQEFIALVITMVGRDGLDAVVRLGEFQSELDYIQMHCVVSTTVEKLAARRGVSREAFSRRFSAMAGIAPKQFLLRAILNRACRLLLERGTKVKDAAIELGFSSEYYFSRFFRRQTGMPPGQFQKLYGRGN